jgi:hypothetical protein
MANRKDRNQVGILMHPDLWKKIRVAALQKDMDASTLVGNVLEEWLKKQKISL